MPVRRRPQPVQEKEKSGDDNQSAMVNATALHTDVGKGLMRRLCHWGPGIAIGITVHVGYTSTLVLLQWWPPYSFFGLLHMAIFLLLNYLTLYNLCAAAFFGPGYVPVGWRPSDSADECRMQLCQVCQGFKAPRSHHCSKCGRCVKKMDHHCPWINNCVGHGNHRLFVQFLLFAVLGCCHAAIILGCSIYRAIFRVWYLYYGRGDEPMVELGMFGMINAIFAFGLAVGVVVAVGFLLYVQIRTILSNRTAIEDYIVGKAECRERDTPFVYPYDLGWRKNVAEVLESDRDGFWWRVRDGCDQFTLTEEQLAQKAAKRQHAHPFEITKAYAGGFCGAWRFGIRTCFCQPWNDEPRVGVAIGQRWNVTRANKSWLYGQLTVSDGDDVPLICRRGWFPRRCARSLPSNQL